MRVRLAVVFRFAVCVAVLAAALSTDASAQTPAPRAQEPPPTAQTAPPRAGVRDADLSITARVTAESLRFEKVPNTRVEFTGKPARETVWEAERENLPQQVQPGVTYRNIGITLRITSVFADIERIVAEALGEVPVNDEARPTPTRPTPTTPAQPSPPSNQRRAAAPPAASTNTPANSGANAPRRRPVRRGRGK